MQNANRRCTGYATMSTERGNYGLITVHAPFLAFGPNQKLPYGSLESLTRDEKFREMCSMEFYQKILYPRVTHCAFIAPLKVLIRPLSQIFLRIPKQYFVFVSSPKDQTHTVCKNRPNIVNLSYRGQTTKLHFGLAR